jgi:outer membrane protein assembly factor BamA
MMTRAFFALIILLGLGATTARAESPPPRKEKGFDAIGVPLLSYNSDLGVGVGAVGGSYVYSPGYKPYRHGIAVQAFFTTMGVQNHWLRYDGPRLLGGARFEARVEYRRELYSPYYGPGNIAVPTFNGDLKDKTYNYDKTAPGAWVRLRTFPLGEDSSFSPYIGYGLRYTDIRPYDQSLLLAQKPIGTQGGMIGQVLLGVQWDTRDDENDTTQGGVEDISVRVAAEPTGSQYNFLGVTLTERRFFQLGTPKLILGLRGTLDYQMGEVPFFEWASIGGLAGGEGIGGMSTVRGVYRNRYSGNFKVVANTELRFYPFDFPLWGQPVKVGGLLFFDTGRVWHPNTPNGKWNDWHPGMGAGLRLARRAAVIRIDYGVSVEEWRQGFYVTFGHMF